MEILDFEDYCKTINIWQDDCRHSVIATVGIADSQNFEIEYSTKPGLVNGHTIIVGSSGSGKTAFLHAFIMGLALKYSPEEVRFILADYHYDFGIYASNKLPHADFIAYPDDADVLLHLLAVTKSKIEERQRLFKDCHVVNYSEFREKYPDEKLPRYFVVFDGYERLFIDSESRFKAKEYIEYITKHAIAINYGINLVLASQHCPFTREVLNNFTTRIVLYSHRADTAHFLLGPGNKYLDNVPCLQYEAIIATADNCNKTRLYYLSPEKRNQYLNVLADKAKEEHLLTPRLLVSDGTAAAYLSNNRTYSQMKPRPYNDSVLFSPGETVFNDGNDLMKTLDRTKRQNIFVTGGDLVVSTRALYGCLASMLPQFEKVGENAPKFDMFDFIDPIEEFKETLDKKLLAISLDYPGSRVCDDSDMDKVLDETLSDLEERKNNPEKIYPSRFIVIFQMDNSKSLNPIDLTKGTRVNVKRSPVLEKLFNLLVEGPEFGIHCLLHTYNYDGLCRICAPVVDEYNQIRLSETDVNNQSRTTMLSTMVSNFKHRILLQMDRDESMLLMKSRYASCLNDYFLSEQDRINRAIYYNRDTPQNKNTIIKPYEFEIEQPK